MEIKIEGVDNCLPPKCYIGIRSGGVQKQAPYDPKTIYRFPDVKRFGRVDIYQQIGTCELAWNCDDQEVRMHRALDANKKDTGMRLKVSINRSDLTSKNGTSPDKAGAPSEKGGASTEKTDSGPKTGTASNAKADIAAKSAKYLSDRGVEEMLTAAMRSLLKNLPDDAPGFLCHFISSNYAIGKTSEPAIQSKAGTPAPHAPAQRKAKSAASAGKATVSSAGSTQAAQAGKSAAHTLGSKASSSPKPKATTVAPPMQWTGSKAETMLMQWLETVPPKAPRAAATPAKEASTVPTQTVHPPSQRAREPSRPVPELQQPDKELTEMDELRRTACDTLVKASLGGGLEKALKEVILGDGNNADRKAAKPTEKETMREQASGQPPPTKVTVAGSMDKTEGREGSAGARALASGSGSHIASMEGFAQAARGIIQTQPLMAAHLAACAAGVAADMSAGAGPNPVLATSLARLATGAAQQGSATTPFLTEAVLDIVTSIVKSRSN